MDQVDAMKKELARVRQQKRELKITVETQRKEVKKLRAYIAELEERLGDPCAGSSAIARDLLNAERQLKELEAKQD
jgi:regulator of replication initiation timing